MVGNLNTYIGAEFGKTGYARDREAEFALKNVPQVGLVDEIEKMIIMIGNTFDMMYEDQLNEKYPVEIFLTDATTQYFFVHLTMHLGQINYHRRLLDKW